MEVFNSEDTECWIQGGCSWFPGFLGQCRVPKAPNSAPAVPGDAEGCVGSCWNPGCPPPAHFFWNSDVGGIHLIHGLLQVCVWTALCLTSYLLCLASFLLYSSWFLTNQTDYNSTETAQIEGIKLQYEISHSLLRLTFAQGDQDGSREEHSSLFHCLLVCFSGFFCTEDHSQWKLPMYTLQHRESLKRCQRFLNYY